MPICGDLLLALLALAVAGCRGQDVVDHSGAADTVKPGTTTTKTPVSPPPSAAMYLPMLPDREPADPCKAGAVTSLHFSVFFAYCFTARRYANLI